MHDKYSLGQYASLIFTRLDLPKVPSVDPTAILNWMNAPHRKVMESQVSFLTRFTTGKHTRGDQYGPMMGMSGMKNLPQCFQIWLNT